MTTQIQDVYASQEAAWIGRAVPDSGVYIGIDKHREFRRDVIIDRAEFLAAVEAELDVIVIARTDLPGVKIVGGGPGGYDAQVGGQVHGILPDHTPDTYRSLAHRYLALAEHLENNPPVDEEQVDALSRAMKHEGMNHTEAAQVARRLIASGRVTVKDTDR